MSENKLPPIARVFSGRPGMLDLAKQHWVDKMVMCDDMEHFINLNRGKSHYEWVMRKHPDGGYYSIRKASDNELRFAAQRAEWLESHV